ncbi:hypothetical protein [Methylobacterium sp. Leaf85]|uniref:hypothetical protein n=1 Tax=Methylobacterium sp. Leaf85 TaxID=1736241 RepID=UPI0006F7FFD4|nr:hypothetical protein [Methylobacterium sp. Leaf85]KQO42519.1 hypothetical protein ASF08_13055 [Methylobacterium sp. Leaf85]
MIRISTGLLVASLCGVLGACADDPLESAMQQAMTRSMTQAYQGQFAAASFLMGGSRGQAIAMPTITDFHKIGCEPAQPAAGHLCEFTVSLNGRESKNKGHFFKAPDGTLPMAER